MYTIIAYDSAEQDAGHVVFDTRIGRTVMDGKLNLNESEIDNLQLTVNQNNWLYGNVSTFNTHIEVYDDDQLLFRGRAFKESRQMKDSGQFVQEFNFESIQNYLQDTSQRWAKIQNKTPKEFFQRLIGIHNSQVPPYKRFNVRNVDVTNSTDNVYRYIEDGATTWDTIKDKLISRLGGYIVVEYKNGVNYIDYLQDIGVSHYEDMPIQLAVNLQSATLEVDSTEVITQLVPLGATIQEDDSSEPNPDTAVSQPRVDITTVNNGKDYIDIPELQKEFGIIRKSIDWDDVHDPNILHRKAKSWIQNQLVAQNSWTVNALELPGFEKFKVSDRYQLNVQQISKNQLLRITAKEIDFLSPHKSSLTIAEKSQSLSDYQLENNQSKKQASLVRSQIYSYGTKIADLNKTQKELDITISNQKTLIDNIQQDVDNADLIGISKQLDQLSSSVSGLEKQLSEIDYVTTTQFEAYKISQAEVIDKINDRLTEIEK